jgi:hypothetical protein
VCAFHEHVVGKQGSKHVCRGASEFLRCKNCGRNAGWNEWELFFPLITKIRNKRVNYCNPFSSSGKRYKLWTFCVVRCPAGTSRSVGLFYLSPVLQTQLSFYYRVFSVKIMHTLQLFSPTPSGAAGTISLHICVHTCVRTHTHTHTHTTVIVTACRCRPVSKEFSFEHHFQTQSDSCHSLFQIPTLPVGLNYREHNSFPVSTTIIVYRFWP